MRKAIQVLDASGNPLDGRVFLAPDGESMARMVSDYTGSLPAGSSWAYCEEDAIRMPQPEVIPEV